MSYTAAVLTISDKGSRGERADTSGPALVGLLRDAGYAVVHTAIVPDEAARIRAELIRCSDALHVALVLTTGGTGFSPRDVTPEATLAVVERETPGIPELMRAASCRITPRGCLSRGVAGIRGGTLIVNLPGSEKAARENYAAVADALSHGLAMLASAGSADCGEPVKPRQEKKPVPSMDAWRREAKADRNAEKCGMFLVPHGGGRIDAKQKVRDGAKGTAPVAGMLFSYDETKLAAAVEAAKQMPGVFHVRVWLNAGRLSVGDDIMYVLVGGDTRPHVIDALQTLVGTIKNECVIETELFEA
jgi:molybdenum cofactor synthesis domain-containing protein